MSFAGVRVACLLIPDFPIWAERRRNPSLRQQLLAIGPERGPLTSLAEEAVEAGVVPGMTRTQALARVPTLVVRPEDPALIEAETQSLTRLLRSFSPSVEVGIESKARSGRGRDRHDHASAPSPSPLRSVASGRFHLDLRGLGRLYGVEPEFARRVMAALRLLSYPACIGIAASKTLATIAADEARQVVRQEGLRASDANQESVCVKGICIVSPGNEASFLAPLPLTHLPLAEASQSELIALGLTTIGDFLALPIATVASRFPSEVVELHGLAQGRIAEALALQPESPHLLVTVELDQPAEELATLVFPLKQATTSLAARLLRHNLALTQLLLHCELDDHSRVTRLLRTQPTRSPSFLLDLLRTTLGASPPFAAPVKKLLLEALEVAPHRTEQPSLFARRAQVDPEGVQQALARIRAMIGPGSLVSPRLADTHRPEAQIAWEPFQLSTSTELPRHPPVPSVSSHPTTSKRTTSRRPATKPAKRRQLATPPSPAFGRLPGRLLTAPTPATVSVVAGRPTFLACGPIRGRITLANGPHRLCGAWWDDPFDRDYFTVSLADGQRYWLYRAAASWYLHGFFD